MYSFIKRLAKKFYDRNEAFNRHMRKQGAKIGKHVQIVDRFNFLYEPWFANLIEIGDGVVIAAGVRLISHDSSYANVFSDLPIRFGWIVIKKNSYIGAGSIILPGISIGEHSLIGAGSLVNRDIPPYSIAAGNPARVIGDTREGLIRFKNKINNHSDASVFYLDMGGSYTQQRSIYGKDTSSEVIRKFNAYCDKNELK